MRIAVEGCAHGELEKIYDTIKSIEKQENYKIDLLICCGDFQSTRNLDDLQTMAVPRKYQDICTFYKYYSGENVAPVLTIFIGGNHEASNYLQELPYGGWVAPKIYYLGYAGVININGIRIAGLSGIYKGHDYLRGHHEFSPYTESTKKSVYHVRQLEVYRLKQLSGDIDIFLSHDWPRGIYNYGNFNQLIRFKPHFRDEIDCNKLGSPACEELLKTLKPTFWFSAHLHCKFAAFVQHEKSEKTTKFLALDKCLPKRRFLQVLEIDSEYTDDGELKFEYDLEWLTILLLTNHLISTKTVFTYMPGPNGSGRFDFTPTDDEKEVVKKKFNNDLKIPDNFTRTADAYSPSEIKTFPQQPKSQINPQTSAFCDTLGIDDPLSIAVVLSGQELSHSSTLDGSLSESSYLNESGDQCSMNSSGVYTPMKRKSLLASLPKPKCDDSNPEELLVEEEEHQETEILEAETSSVDSPAIEEAISTVNPPVKKFKRRNQELYSNIDE